MKHDKGLWHQMQSAIVWVTWFDKSNVFKFPNYLSIFFKNRIVTFWVSYILHFQGSFRCVALGGVLRCMSPPLKPSFCKPTTGGKNDMQSGKYPSLWHSVTPPPLKNPGYAPVVTFHVKSCYVFVLMLHFATEVVKLFCISCDPILWHDRVTNYEWHNLVDWTLVLKNYL